MPSGLVITMLRCVAADSHVYKFYEEGIAFLWILECGMFSSNQIFTGKTAGELSLFALWITKAESDLLLYTNKHSIARFITNSLQSVEQH